MIRENIFPYIDQVPEARSDHNNCKTLTPQPLSYGSRIMETLRRNATMAFILRAAQRTLVAFKQ